MWAFAAAAAADAAAAAAATAAAANVHWLRQQLSSVATTKSD
jgi:hypothetical protein